MTAPQASLGRFDVLMHGTVFFDVVLTGLPSLPHTGTEILAEGMGSCPGGIANLAIAASRLGLRTCLAATFSDDVYGDFLHDTLSEQEGVDLSMSRRVPGWHSPVTVSLAVSRDRAMVTHSHPSPVSTSDMLAELPDCRAGVVHLDESDPWVERAAASGMRLFGDLGWDASEQWSIARLDQLKFLEAFLPNSIEAMAYTRTDDPLHALRVLSDLVPVTVVTCGGQGAVGRDSRTGEEAWVPSLPVNAVDATGAGDVFAAGFVLGSLREWPLEQRMAFANLCAALSVQQVGGSLAAPGWGDLADWLDQVTAEAAAGSDAAVALRDRYLFLRAEIPEGPVNSVRRATATIARQSDA